MARHFRALQASSDIRDVIDNPEIDLVLIATRHHDHAELALQGLRAGKHVFVEKPLAVNQEQLDQIKSFYRSDHNKNKPLLMVGFNRRFSPAMREVKRHVEKRANPLFMHYRMNAGFAPGDSWVHEDGGRIVGEACHIIDLMLFFVGAQVREIQVGSLRPSAGPFQGTDNKSFSLSFTDGSLAVIDYFSNGSKELPKEMLEVHFDGKSIVVEDYKRMTGYGLKVPSLQTKLARKGHLEEWQALANSLTAGADWPIPLQEMIDATAISFIVANS
jgi:predicted dehydrogenase